MLYESVFVTEEDREARRYSAGVLQDAGYRVVEVSSVRVLGEPGMGDCTLLWLQLQLPGRRTVEIATEIRGLTDPAAAADVVNMFAAGCGVYASRPLDVTDVHDFVRHARGAGSDAGGAASGGRQRVLLGHDRP